MIPSAQKHTTILSIKENILIEARFLQNARERLAAGKFRVEGEEQILWALETGPGLTD